MISANPLNRREDFTIVAPPVALVQTGSSEETTLQPGSTRQASAALASSSLKQRYLELIAPTESAPYKLCRAMPIAKTLLDDLNKLTRRFFSIDTLKEESTITHHTKLVSALVTLRNQTPVKSFDALVRKIEKLAEIILFPLFVAHVAANLGCIDAKENFHLPWKTREAALAVTEGQDIFQTIQQIGQGGQSTVYAVCMSGQTFAQKKDLSDAELLHSELNPPLLLSSRDGAIYPIAESTITEKCNKAAMTTSEFSYYLGHVTNSIAHTHRKGIVHRDIKGANVLIVDDLAKLIDFGTAAEISDIEAWKRPFGTSTHHAPEVGLGMLDHLSEKTDIFSFGVLLHELLLGTYWVYRDAVPRSPFATPLFFAEHNDSTLCALIDKTCEEQSARLDRLDPAHYWVDVMKMCLRKNPEERPSANQLVEMAENVPYKHLFA